MERWISRPPVPELAAGNSPSSLRGGSSTEVDAPMDRRLFAVDTYMYNIGVMNMTDHYPFVDHGLQKVFISGDLELIAFAFPSHDS